MEELIRMMGIEKDEIKKSLKIIDKRDPRFVSTIKELKLKYNDLSQALKKVENRHLIYKHNIEDVVTIALHNYNKKTVRIGKLHPSYEKLVEAHQKYEFVDFCYGYKNNFFEPKSLEAWKFNGNLIPGTSIILASKASKKGYEDQVKQAIDGIGHMLGRGIRPKEKEVLKAPIKYKRLIVHDKWYKPPAKPIGIHARNAADLQQISQEFENRGGQIRMLYNEELIDPTSMLTVMSHGIPEGFELIFRYSGLGHTETHDKIANAFSCLIYKDKKNSNH